MKLKRTFIVLSMIALALFGSCASDEEETTIGNWSKTVPFKGRPRGGTVSFTIGDKVFAGLGYDGDDYITDFYVFDINEGYWSTLNDFEGTPREKAVAFVANGKAYVGLGYNRDLDKEELGDFWEYDPTTDDWNQVKDFEGTARYNAIAFSINDIGYVGTGYDGDNYNSDIWQYDATTNDWTEIVSYPGEKIEGGVSFVVNDKGYICAGTNNGSYTSDFWEFTPAADQTGGSWTKRTPSSSASDYSEFKAAVYRTNAVALTNGTLVYLVGGVVSGAASRDVYVLDATTFTWDDRTSYEGAARTAAIGYVLDNRIFVGTGQNGSSHFDDVWEFKPSEEYDEDY